MSRHEFSIQLSPLQATHAAMASRDEGTCVWTNLTGRNVHRAFRVITNMKHNSDVRDQITGAAAYE